jgi:Na+/proline symporter
MAFIVYRPSMSYFCIRFFHKAMGLTSLDLILLATYIAIVMSTGYWHSRTQSHEDYLILGRKLPLFSFIATVSASWIGGGAIVAYTAYVYEFGVAALSVYIGACVAMTIFSFHAIAIRKEAHEKKF